MFQVLIFSFVLQEDESIKYHQLFSLTPIHRLYIRIEPHDDFHDFWWICKMLSFDELDCKILYERVNYCKKFPISNTSRQKICRTTLWDFLDIFYQSNLHTHTSAHKRTRRKSHEKFMIYLGRVSDVSATADDVIRTHFPSIISLTIVLCVCWWFIDKNPITKPEQNLCWCSSPPSFFSSAVTISQSETILFRLFLLHQQRCCARCGDVIGNSLCFAAISLFFR